MAYVNENWHGDFIKDTASIEVFWTRFDSATSSRRKGKFLYTPVGTDTRDTMHAAIETKVTNEDGIQAD